MKRSFLTGILLSLVASASGQNNPIFYGGSGDGWGSTSYLQNAVATMYNGGVGDGWNGGSYSQSSVPTLFNGGSGDGYNLSFYNQQSFANLFQGGAGDGWNLSSYSQQSLASLFQGGAGDGWMHNSYLQQGNISQFFGGVGDGWASTYHPLAPLPINFLFFNAAKKESTAVLSWELAQDEDVAEFEVERSAEAVSFTRIGSVNQSNDANKRYQYDDVAPLTGHNYYRLKVLKQDGKYEYTGTRLVVFEATDEGGIKVYPNPASDFVRVSLTGSWASSQVVINMYDAAGKLVYHRKFTDAGAVLEADTRQLAAGSYFMHIASGSFSGRKKLVIAK